MSRTLRKCHDDHAHLREDFEASDTWKQSLFIKQSRFLGKKLVDQWPHIGKNKLENRHEFRCHILSKSSESAKEVDQSFAACNAILFVVFAEEHRRKGSASSESATHAAKMRMRPILMTSMAMIAGMIPMALGLGEGSQQTAPLGRAVIGGLSFATATTLLILPLVFSVVQQRASVDSPSLDPDDPQSILVKEENSRPEKNK